MQPLVSIIIPTYNRAHLIGETLDSVLAQTYANWECIVVDDGSSDNTDEVVGAYVKKDPRFQYHKRPDTHKPGGNGARNYGFGLSNGEYVQWFDSDDVMFKECIKEKVNPFINDKTLDIVFCAYTYFDKNGIKNRVSNLTYSGDILGDKLKGKLIFSTLSFLVKKKVVTNHFFDETIRKSQDVDFFFRLFSKNPDLNIQHVSTPLYKVRKNHGQISTAVSKSGIELKSKCIVHERILQFYKKENNLKGIQVNKKIIQLQLKLLLENKNYFFVINTLIKSNYFTFKEKIIMLFYSIVYILTGRGINKFKLI